MFEGRAGEAVGREQSPRIFKGELQVDPVLHCVNCEEDFKAGAWYNCQGNPTRKHVVKVRTFYSEHDRYCVNAIPETNMLGNHGERIHVAGAIVTFNG